MLFVNELLWTIIGLLLTIFSVFAEASIVWNFRGEDVSHLSLGITLQIGAVLLTGCMGGKNAGFLSQISYLLLGLFLYPIFINGGGLQYFRDPTFGYILGFAPGAWLCGWLSFKYKTKLEILLMSTISGLLAIHIFGLTYLFIFWMLKPLVLSTPDLLNLMMNYSIDSIFSQLTIACATAFLAFILRHILFY
ncbi:MAG: biotin transporter BioY [Candidatus Atelocyanobacterium thalassa]